MEKSSKFGAVIDLTAYYKFLKIEWEKPKYKPVRELPFIPTEEELDIVISAPRTFLSTLLLLLKETGSRYGEALTIKWEDIDFQRRIVRIKPEKNSNPRMLPLSTQLINMLNKNPRKNEIVFYKNPKTIRNSFSYAKNHTAEKLQNPRIKKITFHTFRQ